MSSGAAGCERDGDERVERPSMLLIVVDTLRADHVGSYGYARPTTPNIDRWARGGTVFERAYSTSSWTLPAIASMLTGLWPTAHGAGIYPGKHRQVEIIPLADDLPTLPAMLAEAGYRTGAIMNNPILQPSLALDRGFDDYDYVESSNHEIRNAAQVVDLALAWIAREPERPFFLFLHVMDPHLDYDPPESVRGRFTSGYTGALDRPIKVKLRKAEEQAALEGTDRDFVVGLHDEEILFVDGELARLLAVAADRNVLTVLTSDHGEEFWDHGDFEHGHTMYEELLRVPLIAVGPGVAARRVTDPVSTVDLMPTLAEAAAIEVPPATAGRSLLATLYDAAPPHRRPLVASGILYGTQQAAVVDGDLKGIVSLTSEVWQLFDLAADPAETVDLAAEPSAAISATIERMESVLRASAQVRPASERAAGSARDGGDRSADEKVIEGLKSLGYVDGEGRSVR